MCKLLKGVWGGYEFSDLIGDSSKYRKNMHA